MCGRIGRGRLVEDFDIRLERDERMRKSGRDQQLTPVFRRELDRDIPAESRRRTANVDRDVEDAAARDAHQLGLRERRRLKVQAPQRAGGRGNRVVVLNESNSSPALSQDAQL